jgi:hypothetical protein
MSMRIARRFVHRQENHLFGTNRDFGSRCGFVRILIHTWTPLGLMIIPPGGITADFVLVACKPYRQVNKGASSPTDTVNQSFNRGLFVFDIVAAPL